MPGVAGGLKQSATNQSHKSHGREPSNSRGSNGKQSHKEAASEFKSCHEPTGTNRSSSEQKTDKLLASSRRQESQSGFKSFRQDFNDTIENTNHNNKLLVQVEGLKVNETRYEDAEGDDRGYQEAQD